MTDVKNARWLRLIALLAALLVAFAACGGGDDDENGGTDAGGQEEEEVTLPVNSEGVLQVGSCLDYKPFEFVKGGDEMGFDVDLAEEIASRLGLEVEWVTANFDTIFTSVAAGQFDMVAAASTITEERLQTVDFSDPYFSARQSMAVNTEENPDITGTADIGDGHVVGVQKGTTGKAWAEENLAPQGAQIKTFDGAPAAYTDLEAGGVDAVLNDEGSAIAEVSQRPSLEIVEAIDTDENYGFAFAKEDADLTEAVNEALAEIIEDGTYAQIFKEWFPDLPVPEQFQGS